MHGVHRRPAQLFGILAIGRRAADNPLPSRRCWTSTCPARAPRDPRRTFPEPRARRRRNHPAAGRSQASRLLRHSQYSRCCGQRLRLDARATRPMKVSSGASVNVLRGEPAAPSAQGFEDRAPPGAGGARSGEGGDGKRNGAHRPQDLARRQPYLTVEQHAVRAGCPTAGCASS